MTDTNATASASTTGGGGGAVTKQPEEKKAKKKPTTTATTSSPKKSATQIQKRTGTAAAATKKEQQKPSPLGAAIPFSPFFDDDKKWKAHVMSTTDCMASEQAIGLNGVTFPVRIQRWGLNKMSSDSASGAGNSSGGGGSGSSNAMIAYGSNRGAIAIPGSSTIVSVKDPKKKFRTESYYIVVECGSFAGVPSAVNSQHLFLPLDISNSTATQDAKIQIPISRITGEKITHKVINSGQHLRIFTNSSSIKDFTSMDIAFCVKCVASLAVAPSTDSEIWDLVDKVNKSDKSTPPMKRVVAGEKTMLDSYIPTRFSKLSQLPIEVLQGYFDRTSDKMTDTERCNLELEFPEIAYQIDQTKIGSANKPIRVCSGLNSSMFMHVVKMDYPGQAVGDFLAGLTDPARKFVIESAFEWVQHPLEQNVYMVFYPMKLQNSIAKRRGCKIEDVIGGGSQQVPPNSEVTTRWAMTVYEGSGYKCFSKILNKETPCLRFSAVGETWKPGCYYKEEGCVNSRVLINASCVAWTKEVVQAYGISNVDVWTILAPQIMEYGRNVFSCRVNISATGRIPSVAKNNGDMRLGDTMTCALDVEEIYADMPDLLNRIGIPISATKAMELIGRMPPNEIEISNANTSTLPAVICLSECPGQLATAMCAKCTYRVLCNNVIEELIPSFNEELGDAIFTPDWCTREDIRLPSGATSHASDDLRKNTLFVKINDSTVRYVWAIRSDIKVSYERVLFSMDIFHNGTKYDDNGMAIMVDLAAAGKRGQITDDDEMEME